MHQEPTHIQRHTEEIGARKIHNKSKQNVFSTFHPFHMTLRVLYCKYLCKLRLLYTFT